MITPFKLFLTLIVIMFFCYLADDPKSYGERPFAIIGGISLILTLIDIIWMIFYYL